MALCDAVLHGSRRSFYQLSSNDEGGAYVYIYGAPSEGIWRCLVHFCALILRWCMMILLAVLQGCLFLSLLLRYPKKKRSYLKQLMIAAAATAMTRSVSDLTNHHLFRHHRLRLLGMGFAACGGSGGGVVTPRAR